MKKLVLEAKAMGFGDSERAAGSISENIFAWNCSVEGQRVYTYEWEGPKN